MSVEVVVGFIGLGTMGGKMATNIQKAGYKVVVHDLHRQSASHHLQAGAEWADTPRAVAKKSDVILTSLPDPADVKRVALGASGLIEGVKKGAVYFDLSTNSPGVIKRIYDAFAAKGAQMLDAPVSGGPSGAASRKMAIWVGGDKASFDKYRAVLDTMGDRATYIGEIGTATVTKLVHNMSGYAITCALAENRGSGSRHVHPSHHARREVTLWKTKTGRPRTIPLTDRAYEALLWAKQQGWATPWEGILHLGREGRDGPRRALGSRSSGRWRPAPHIRWPARAISAGQI